MKKTLIIGAGPAGASCGLWLHQLGCEVLLLEGSDQAGGLQKQSPYRNEWFPAVEGLQGREIARNLHVQLLERGVALRTNARVLRVHVREQGASIDLADGSQLQADYLVVATGAKFRTGGFTATPRLAIGPGRNFEAMDMAGKRVGILGGGDNAFDAHKFAMQRGAAHAQIFARQLRAQRLTMGRVPKDCVSLGAFQVDPQAMTINGQAFDCISVQFGFEAVVPEGLEQLARTPGGHLLANAWGQTSLPGIYAVGEVAATFHPATVTSMAHGIQAAKHIQTCMES